MMIYRLLTVLVLFLSLSASAAAQGMRQDVHVFADRFGWPGAVALEVDRAGVRDLVVEGECRSGRPMTLDTPLMVGSVSKAFTGRAILELASQRRLDLDAPIKTQWPGLGPIGNSTPRQLLTHTSGLTARQGMTVVGAPDLSVLAPAAAPGLRRYSNLNYNLLGALAARRVGAGFGPALDALVAKPDGLASLAVAGEAARTCGHTMAFGVVLPRREPEWSPWIAPAGFLQVNPVDLARLEIELLNDPDAGRGGALDPLLGWKKALIGGEAVFSHSGQIGGARATLVLMPTRGKGLVIMVNRGGDFLQDPVDQLALRSVQRLQGRPQPPIPWPWERLVRVVMLMALVGGLWRLARNLRRVRLGSIPLWRWGAGLAIVMIVPVLTFNVTGLSVGALWRLAPDMFIVLLIAPMLAMASWAMRPQLRGDRTAR